MSGALVAVEKAHSELGASIASRWMACPGSVRLSRGLPNTTSEAAKEGTRAHALAELCLTKGVDTSFFVGMEVEGVVIDEDMADYVQMFVDECRRYMTGTDLWWVERRFNLAHLNPPDPMFGTADFAALRPDGELVVIDLKYGQGVVVEASGNPQLRYYGLGAALSVAQETGRVIDRVSMAIVQPRVSHPAGIVRYDAIDYAELIEFAAALMAAARATQAPDAPLAAGRHCKFCPAGGICPEQYQQSQAIAQTTFSITETAAPPAPETLPPALFSEILGQLPILEAWITAMKGHAFGRLERGEAVPGFKLVEKRAQRRWRDPEETAAWMAAKSYADEEIYERKIKSPAQIEKVVGKKNLPADLITKTSSGVNMVPDSHPGTAVTLAAGHQFSVLLGAGSETAREQTRD